MLNSLLSKLSLVVAMTSVSWMFGVSGVYADSIVIGERGIVLDSSSGSKVVVGKNIGKVSSNVDSISINGGKAVTGRISGDCEEGSGKVKTETRIVSGFKSINVEGAYDLVITAGSPFSLKITSDDNLLPFIKTAVENGTLTVTSSRSICTKADLKIQVTMPELTTLTSEGSTDINVMGVKNKKLNLNIGGSGTLTAAGETQQLEINASGSVDITATELKAKTVFVKMEGAGDAKVSASDTLKVNLEGAGSVLYKGKPQITKTIDGVGEVEPLTE